jgi:hypothetical protein
MSGEISDIVKKNADKLVEIINNKDFDEIKKLT